jgi:hypothetical protein
MDKQRCMEDSDIKVMTIADWHMLCYTANCLLCETEYGNDGQHRELDYIRLLDGNSETETANCLLCETEYGNDGQHRELDYIRLLDGNSETEQDRDGSLLPPYEDLTPARRKSLIRYVERRREISNVVIQLFLLKHGIQLPNVVKSPISKIPFPGTELLLEDLWCKEYLLALVAEEGYSIGGERLANIKTRLLRARVRAYRATIYTDQRDIRPDINEQISKMLGNLHSLYVDHNNNIDAKSILDLLSNLYILPPHFLEMIENKVSELGN